MEWVNGWSYGFPFPRLMPALTVDLLSRMVSNMETVMQRNDLRVTAILRREVDAATLFFEAGQLLQYKYILASAEWARIAIPHSILIQITQGEYHQLTDELPTMSGEQRERANRRILLLKAKARNQERLGEIQLEPLFSTLSDICNEMRLGWDNYFRTHEMTLRLIDQHTGRLPHVNRLDNLG